MSVTSSSPAHGTLTEAFDAVVVRSPHATLLSYGGRKWTYQEVDRWSDTIASQLASSPELSARGVVGVSSNSTPLVLASYLGVLKAGHAYAGLDPSLPSDRLATMSRVAGLSAYLVDEDQYPRARAFSKADVPVLVASDTDHTRARRDTSRAPSPDDLSHVLFTSGSTGVPKAVPRKHEHILHNTWRHGALGISGFDKVALISRNGFWDAVSNPYNAMLNGATICATRMLGAEDIDLADWIEREEVTVYYSLATIFRGLVATRRASHKLESLRLLYIGGERVEASDLLKCRALLRDDAKVAIGLASTETGITALNVTAVADLDTTCQPSVGKPVDGVTIEVRTESGALAATNERGQIVIRSSYIFAGYPHVSDEENARIYPDAKVPGQYVYESGDAGFLDLDGELTVVGRLDHQVKIRGFRVELGEIESTLRNASSIADVAVVFTTRAAAGPGDTDGEIVAFLVAQSSDPDIRQLRAWLQEKLPEYMIPTRMWLIDRIPRLRNGKVDRVELAKRDREKQDERAAVGPQATPVGELELTVARMWSELLEVPSIGRSDRFFETGGNSLKALMFIFNLSEHLGTDLPYGLILEDDRLSGFCRLVSERISAAQKS